MAHVAIGSPFVLQGVAGQDIGEGLAVVQSASGIRGDVPTAMLAASGTTTGVYLAILPPDRFPRPTRQGFFTAPYYRVGDPDPRDATETQFAVESDTWYNIGPSLRENPTIPSGWLLQLHRGGVYTVPSGRFVESVNIRVPGAGIMVGANGKWQYTASNPIGEVKLYRDGKLSFTLYQK